MEGYRKTIKIVFDTQDLCDLIVGELVAVSINTKICSDQQTRDDAPFSCCNRQSCYPCIHHDLMSVGSTYLYAPETNLSVSERGCYYVLFKHTQAIAWRVCVSVILLALLEMVVVAVHRLLQTAHVELFRYERNFHWHSAWLFGVYKERERAGKSVPPKPPPIPYELMN